MAYKCLKSKNELAAVFVASAVAPIVNTGIFIIGALTMYDTVSAMSAASNASVVYFLFILCAGVNFIIEFALNMFLASSVWRIIKAVRKA